MCYHQCTSNCRREGCPCDEHEHEEQQETLGDAVNKVFVAYKKLTKLMDNVYEKPRS